MLKYAIDQVRSPSTGQSNGAEKSTPPTKQRKGKSEDSIERKSSRPNSKTSGEKKKESNNLLRVWEISKRYLVPILLNNVMS